MINLQAGAGNTRVYIFLSCLSGGIMKKREQKDSIIRLMNITCETPVQPKQEEIRGMVFHELKKRDHMKKTILTLSLTMLVFILGAQAPAGPDEPKPRKDTVNIDTDAKPEFYYAVEDEQSGAVENGSSSKTPIAIIAGVIIVAGIAGWFLLRKRK
jgi:LPXTG-motif cell wall-anchored protein